MTERRKRLIEVAFPLEEVSEHSRRDKYLRTGHISTLHIWWARRPLSACRAFIYASLVDNPDDENDREQLVKEVADLANWDAVHTPNAVVRSKAEGGSGLTGAELLARARHRIVASNGGQAPRLLDPFAGGGAIPLEALRLGCVVEATDLNPVAVLVLKATLDYPQRYGKARSRQVPTYIIDEQKRRESGQPSLLDGDLLESYSRNPLATDVRYWGNWILDRARSRLRDLYPVDEDGGEPVAYFWSRSIDCSNCGFRMPLLRQYWLVNKPRIKVALEPLPDEEYGVRFRVVEGEGVSGNPALATTSKGDTKCLTCHQVVKAAAVSEAGRAGRLRDFTTASAFRSPRRGKRYRPPSLQDREAYSRAERMLEEEWRDECIGELPAIPDEPIDPATLGLRIDAMGFACWGQLFNARQTLSLLTFVTLVKSAYEAMRLDGLEPDYAEAITTCLGLVVDRLAVRNSNQCIYNAKRETIENEIARGVLPPVWDYVEANPIGNASGSWPVCLEGLCAVLKENASAGAPARVMQADATTPISQEKVDIVITDPPYYAAVDYAGLSDFFYVWLKRSIAFLHSELLSLPLSPKKQQAIMASESANPEARERYVQLMQSAFDAMKRRIADGLPVGVVFANSDPDAWATLIEGLLAAGFVPDASWPIDTEMQSGMAKVGQARLKTSVWMACATRNVDATEAFLGDVMAEMRPVIRERLLYFWNKGIRGADFFVSGIGPALSVFGRHGMVLRPDGSEVTVRDFLGLVRHESTHVALEQVLQGADLGAVDSPTQQYVTWVWSYSRAPLDAGEAIALCLATGAEYSEIVRSHAIAAEMKEKSKKVVKLRTIKERGEKDEELGLDQPARPAPLIDQLQRAAWLWGRNQTDILASYRAALGESRWAALRTLGNAVAGCLPDGDEDKRLILGVLSSSAMGAAPPRGIDGSSVGGHRVKPATAGATLPGFEEGGGDGA